MTMQDIMRSNEQWKYRQETWNCRYGVACIFWGLDDVWAVIFLNKWPETVSFEPRFKTIFGEDPFPHTHGLCFQSNFIHIFPHVSISRYLRSCRYLSVETFSPSYVPPAVTLFTLSDMMSDVQLMLPLLSRHLVEQWCHPLDVYSWRNIIHAGYI